MHQFFVEPSCVGAGEVIVSGGESAHMKKALRIRPGEKVKICDGNNNVYVCVLQDYTDNNARLVVEKRVEFPRELLADIVLFQGLPKQDKMADIIQKCVELGVHGIVPVKMNRCVVKIDEEKSKKRLERWNLIARSAAKQSGRGIIPRVLPVTTLDEAVNMAKKLDTVLVPYELKQNMAESRETVRLIRKGMTVGIFIGPEGGFDTREINQLTDLGGKSISLGNRILRTETAGPAILSVLMFQLDE